MKIHHNIKFQFRKGKYDVLIIKETKEKATLRQWLLVKIINALFKLKILKETKKDY